jgi:hypothetical protein
MCETEIDHLMSTPNPYESPRSDSLPFTPTDASSNDLERRVAELERQVARSWFLRPGFLTRVIAVWAYLLVSYAMLAIVGAPIFVLLDWLTSRLFSN